MNAKDIERWESKSQAILVQARALSEKTRLLFAEIRLRGDAEICSHLSKALARKHRNRAK